MILGVLAALIAAAGAMGQIERGSNRIYGVERDRPTVRKYLVAVGLSLSAGVGHGARLHARSSSAHRSVRLWARPRVGAKRPRSAWSIIRWPLGAAFVAVAMALLFKVSPHRHQPDFSWLALGSTLAVVLWFAFTGLLALYVGASRSFGETYGPLAGFIGLMLWAFVGALALLLGLAVAAQLEAERAGVPNPSRI